MVCRTVSRDGVSCRVGGMYSATAWLAAEDTHTCAQEECVLVGS